VTDGVKTTLHIVAQVADGIVHAIEALQDGGVYAIETLAQGLLDASLTQSEVVQVGQNSGIVEASGKVSLSGTRLAAISASRTIAATEATKTVATPAEQEQDYDPSPIIAKHTAIVVAVISVVAYDCCYIGSRKLGNANRQLKNLLSFLNL
jgi:hypothetical protein